VPSAIKHDHELSSKGLVSVLVHSQQATEDELQAFLLKTFPDNDCFVTPGGFVPTPASTGIPHAALIGIDGKLLWDGQPLSETKKIQELIDGELLKVKKGWGDTAEGRKVRATLYGKNDFGGAAALIVALPDGDEKTTLQGELDRRYAIQKKSITELQNQGRWLDSQDACKALLKSVGTKAEWVAELQPMLLAFDTPESKVELAADKKLEKIVKQLRDKKRDDTPKALEALLKTAANTKVGERAQRLLTALNTPLP
jgi:hypothetical protein